MRILYSVEDGGGDDSKKFLTLNWKDAHKEFLKASRSILVIFFEDIEQKGNFSQRFYVWKKFGKFASDEGIWIEDCKHKQRKEKQICESWNDFPSDEQFLLKYMR